MKKIQICEECKTPIIDPEHTLTRCPLCNAKLKQLSLDLRPVFPEERKMVEILLDLNLRDKNIWASRRSYLVEGQSVRIPQATWRNTDARMVLKKLQEISAESGSKFEEHITRFVEANRERLKSIESEAHDFIRGAIEEYGETNVCVTFSGGKDSTVTSDLVTQAIPRVKVARIFSDTTLEFPETYAYVERYRRQNPEFEFHVARNDEKDFFEECKSLGVPARHARWCHLMFKAAPMNRFFRELYGENRVLSFSGIRASESKNRAQYTRLGSFVSKATSDRQIFGYPIFNWLTADVWLYLLSKGIDFNGAYRLGHSRVGCFCCPNTASRPEFLARVYMPEKMEKWDKILRDFTSRIGVKDPERYLETRAWQARYGGVDLGLTETVEVEVEKLGDNVYRYKLKKPYAENLRDLFIPFGEIEDEGESFRVMRGKIPLFEVKPSENVLEIDIMTDQRRRELERKIGYQIRKWNACRGCLKCEDICERCAISVRGGKYRIDGEKCTHCGRCMQGKYIIGGCMMSYFLKPHRSYRKSEE